MREEVGVALFEFCDVMICSFEGEDASAEVFNGSVVALGDRGDGGVVLGCRRPLHNEGMGVVNEGKRQPRTVGMAMDEVVEVVFVE